MTGSMQRAIDETNRRRGKAARVQRRPWHYPAGHSEERHRHHEGARSEAPAPGRKRGAKPLTPADLRPEALVKEIKKLEAEMFRKARNLEFEDAAHLRDEIERLKQLELGLPVPLMQS